MSKSTKFWIGVIRDDQSVCICVTKVALRHAQAATADIAATDVQVSSTAEIWELVRPFQREHDPRLLSYQVQRHRFLVALLGRMRVAFEGKNISVDEMLARDAIVVRLGQHGMALSSYALNKHSFHEIVEDVMASSRRARP